MNCGLQTFDSNGKIIIDASSRLQKYLGTMYCPENSRSVSIQNDELLDGTLWYLVVPDSYPENIEKGNENYSYLRPYVHTDGNKLLCDWANDHVACHIQYGVY